jgi:hypothetical protein
LRTAWECERVLSRPSLLPDINKAGVRNTKDASAKVVWQAAGEESHCTDRIVIFVASILTPRPHVFCRPSTAADERHAGHYQSDAREPKRAHRFVKKVPRGNGIGDVAKREHGIGHADLYTRQANDPHY